MKLEDIRLLFEYQNWANARVLDQAEQLTDEEFTADRNSPHGSIRGDLVHIMNTDIGWTAFFKELERPASLPESEFPDVASLRKTWNQAESSIQEYLDSIDEKGLSTNRNLSYFHASVPLWTLNVHLVNHGTQHRSEVAMMLTDLVHSPGDLDMVFFLADRFPSG